MVYAAANRKGHAHREEDHRNHGHGQQPTGQRDTGEVAYRILKLDPDQHEQRSVEQVRRQSPETPGLLARVSTGHTGSTWLMSRASTSESLSGRARAAPPGQTGSGYLRPIARPRKIPTIRPAAPATIADHVPAWVAAFVVAAPAWTAPWVASAPAWTAA